MHSTKLFSFNRETHTFATEASTLGRVFGVLDTITLVSEWTNSIINFKLVETLYHGYGEDREICGWKYAPAHPAALTPTQRKLSITVFNT